MKPIIERPPEPGDPQPKLVYRIGWFAALWAGGLLTVAAAAYGLRALIL